MPVPQTGVGLEPEALCRLPVTEEQVVEEFSVVAVVHWEYIFCEKPIKILMETNR